jgi:hypothetical protein
MMPVSDLITKIHHFGTNVLGMLWMAVSVVLMCLAIFNAESLPKPATMAILTCSMCAPSAFDFLWRYYSKPRSSAHRLLLPGSGGAVLFVPVWLLYLATLLMLFSIIVKAVFKL